MHCAASSGAGDVMSGADTHAPGSGLTLMQLAWACEAFTLDEQGAPCPLQGTTLEVLEEARVSWLLSRRARDLGLLWVGGNSGCGGKGHGTGAGGVGGGGGAFSLDALAHAAFLRDKARAGMVSEVAWVSGLQQARALDSVVLGCPAVYAAWRLMSGRDIAGGLPLASSQQVVELVHAELQVGVLFSWRGMRLAT